MYSADELKKFLEENGSSIVEALKNKDLSIAGLTSQGIANTGSFGNIGDGVFSGNLYVQEDVGEGEDGNLEVEGYIKGKLNTLEPYKTYDLTPSPTVGSRTFTNIYSKAIVSGGLLLLLANFRLANETEAIISAENISLILEVDDEIGDKIYCLNGEKLSDNYTSRQDIATMGVTSGIYLNSYNVRPISKIGKNKLEIVIYVPQLAVNDDIPFSGRQFLSLF